MNQNELQTRIEKLEKQVFGMTYEQDCYYREHSVSDYTVALIKFEIEQLNPAKPRYDFHVGLLQTKYGLNEFDWTHALNVIDSIKRGVRPDFPKEFYPRSE